MEDIEIIDCKYTLLVEGGTYYVAKPQKQNSATS